MQQSPISNFLFANKATSNLPTEILPGSLLATSETSTGTSTGTLTATSQSTGTSSGTSTVVSSDLESSLEVDLGSSLEVKVSSPSLDNTHNQDFPLAPPHSGEGGAISTISSFVWSRSARMKRKLEKASSDDAQTRITDYFKVLDNIEKLVQQNEELSLLLKQFQIGDEENPLSKQYSLTPILNQIILNAERNAKKSCTQRRHPEILKKFATALLFMLDHLHMNLFNRICLKHCHL
jgi:hypothetical protein